jgi:hypothetical protein
MNPHVVVPSSGGSLSALLARAVEEVTPIFKERTPKEKAITVLAQAQSDVFKYTARALELHAKFLAKHSAFVPPDEKKRAAHRHLLIKDLMCGYLSEETASEIADSIIAGKKISSNLS